MTKSARRVRSNSFAQRLAELRAFHGWSQRELARRAGVLQVSVCRYERGAQQPTLANLDRLRVALDLTWDEFLDGVIAAESGG